jgi:hypothetical protein
MQIRVQRFQQLDGPDPEMENIVYSYSRLCKNIFVFSSRFVRVWH